MLKRNKVENYEAMIENRNALISDLQKKNELLLEENIAVYQENKDLRFENEELKDILNDIEKEVLKQNYNSIDNLKNKIKSILMTAKSI